MENAVEQSADFYRLVAWFHANRQRVIAIAAAIVVIAAGIAIYVWHKQNRETQANIALSNIKQPMPAREGAAPPPIDPQAYLSVADEYSGTSAGTRALLMAGGGLFEAGKYDQAQTQFSKFLSQYSDNPLAQQASLGIAASLEAQGKNAEAASRYDDLIRRHPGDSIIPQAKSALARLDVAQNKLEDAARLYEELARSGSNDSWSMEAGIQLEELLAKHPNLRKQPPVPAATMAPTIKVTPATNAAQQPAVPVPAKAAAPATKK